jgi:hypothetical protein
MGSANSTNVAAMRVRKGRHASSLASCPATATASEEGHVYRRGRHSLVVYVSDRINEKLSTGFAVLGSRGNQTLIMLIVQMEPNAVRATPYTNGV